MTSPKAVEQAVRMAAAGPAPTLLDRLSAACRQVLEVEGVGICVMAVSGSVLATSSSDKRVSQLEELQYTLGEGPSPASFAAGAPRSDPDLLAANDQWPVYGQQAAAVIQDGAWPIRSVHAFPLRLRRVPLGVLDVYERRSGDLPPRLAECSLAAVRSVVAALIDATASPQAEDGLSWLDNAPADQARVDQAVGMVMAQLEIDAETALARLRARAFADGRALGEIAHAVVTRRLRFGPEES
jgi:hypothetical protein